MREKIFVSLIICTRNRKEILSRICKSISTQSYNNYEIIIVDSSDNNKIEKTDIQKLFNKSNQINIIYSEPGLTRQRNIGLKAAAGDIFIFFDDDLILEDNFLYEMVKVFNENIDYYGGMGAFTEMNDFSIKEKIKKTIKRFFLLDQDYGNGKLQKSGFPQHPFGRKIFLETEVLAGAMMAYRKEIFKEFEFDEHFSDYSYMEDVDFSHRVSKKHKLFYNPNARAEHRHATGGRGNYFENRRMYIYNHRYLFEKNFPQNLSYSIAHIWSIIGLYIFAFLSFNNPFVAFKAYTRGLLDYKIAKKNIH